MLHGKTVTRKRVLEDLAEEEEHEEEECDVEDDEQESEEKEDNQSDADNNSEELNDAEDADADEKALIATEEVLKDKCYLKNSVNIRTGTKRILILDWNV